jgi:hypothetical protein
MKLPPRELVGPDTPLRLDVAAALAYPDGSMTASGLRKEANKGRLAIERTAGKDYTTLAAIEGMRALCRQKRKDPAYISEARGETEQGASPTPPCTSSETENIQRAQAAAKAIVAELKESSRPTSTANTPPRRAKAPVIPLISPSRMS